MSALLNPDDSRHGTENGYGNLSCRCDACKKAHAAYTQVVKRQRSLEGPSDARHGTENGYGNYNCRCRQCTDAWSEASVARTRRRKARSA